MIHEASIPRDRPFTVADLEAMPDDGNRYELIDGMLSVSPTSSSRFADLVGSKRLAVVLDGTRP